MEASLDKAIQLYQLHKYSLALKETDSVLAEDPQNARAYAIKSLAYLGQKENKNALDNALKAVSSAPDDDFPHYVLSLVHINLTNDYKQAELSIKEALRLNPENADYYEVMAQLKLVKNEFKEALQLCDQGLAIDPQNMDCLSTRARILTKMGKSKEARQNLNEALSLDPENPQTLAKEGWVSLENGDHKRALDAFRDSLKIQPDYEYARDGLLTALKSRNFVYRQYLKYAFWIGKLGNKTRWALFLGIFLFIRLISLAPAMRPIFGLYILFVVSTWLINPISNLILRFDKYGKYALTKSEIIVCNLVVTFIALAIAVAVTGIVIHLPFLFSGAFALFLMIIPISGTGSFYPEYKKKYRNFLIYTICLFILIISGFALFPFSSDTGAILLGICILGEILFTWITALNR